MDEGETTEFDQAKNLISNPKDNKTKEFLKHAKIMAFY